MTAIENLKSVLGVAPKDEAPAASVVGILTKIDRLIQADSIGDAAKVIAGVYRECPSKLFGQAGSDLSRASRWLQDRLRRGDRERFYEDGDLTPALAQLLLDPNFNTQNRTLNLICLEDYIRDARRGAWERNGETIKIASTRELNDGQHRCLTALVTGIALPTTFAFGLRRESRLTNDIGAKRTPGARLQMEGITGGNAKQAMVGLLYPLLQGHKPTHGERHEWFLRHQNIITQSHDLAYTIKLGGTNRSAVAAAAAYLLFRRARPDGVQQFFDLLRSGEGLRSGDAILTLRNALSASGRKMSAHSVMCVIVHQYNRSRLRKTSTKLSHVTEFEAVVVE